MSDALRIVMLGTGPFAVPTFRWLLDSPHQVAALVTQPARPVRGHAPRESPMRAVAQSAGLPILEPERINAADAVAALRQLGADLLVVCDYGQILSPEALAAARLGGINLHGSLLPKYRGAAPIQWAIYHGERQTGVTVIHMTPQLDAGPCLVQEATDIGDEETAPELEARLAELGVGAVCRAIERLAGWDGQRPLGAAQDASQSSKAPRLKKRDGVVDWSRSAEAIRNQVRAFQPWPGTSTHWLRRDGPPLRLLLGHAAALDQPAGEVPPGTVLPGDGRRLLVATGQGVLAIDRLQPAGKRMMEAEALLRGYPIQPGEQLGEAVS